MAAGVVLAAIVIIVIFLLTDHTSPHSSTPRDGSGSEPSATRAAPTGSATSSKPGLLDLLVVCSSTDFDNRANQCEKSDSQLSAGNGGLTIDGDLSFPDYMSGTIHLLKKNGTTWERLGQIPTTLYPDVVTIDSKGFISMQIANLFSYAGQRSMPKCATQWGIEVADPQGLPLGDARFMYVCK